MPSNEQLEYRPPSTALALLVGVGLALSLPAAIAIAALIEGQPDVPAAKFLRVLCVIGPLFIAFAFWIYRGHFVIVKNDNAKFAFTRYGIRRSVTLAKESLRSVSYVHGTLALDGRPRPLIEYELASGVRGWIPLALYSRRLIDALRSDLRSNGIEVIEQDTLRTRQR